MRVHYLKCAYGQYFKLNPIQNGIYISVEVSTKIQGSMISHFDISQKSTDIGRLCHIGHVFFKFSLIQ